MSYKQPSYLKQIWWTIKWFFICNKRVETPSVTVTATKPNFGHAPMDLRLPEEFVEDLSDGALD